MIALLIPAALMCVALASPELLAPVSALLRRARPHGRAGGVAEVEPASASLSVPASARRAE